MNENKILPTILAGGKSSRFGSDKSMAILGDKKILDYTRCPDPRVRGQVHGTRTTDTDPNGYRDFCAKLVKKIPVTVESDVFLVS